MAVVRARWALVGLGSNLGSRRAWLRLATRGLELLSTTSLRRTFLYRSAPMGGPPQRPYFNTAVLMRWQASPEALLEALLSLERRLLRRRTVRWGPRTVDLDLLWMEGVQRDSPFLRVPHPGLFERPFVLLPARHIAPPPLATAVHAAVRALPGGEAPPIRIPWGRGAIRRPIVADDPGEALIDLLDRAAPSPTRLRPLALHLEHVQADGPLQCHREASRRGARLLALAPIEGTNGWEGLLEPGCRPPRGTPRLRRRGASHWEARWRGTPSSKL